MSVAIADFTTFTTEAPVVILEKTDTGEINMYNKRMTREEFDSLDTDKKVKYYFDSEGLDFAQTVRRERVLLEK